VSEKVDEYKACMVKLGELRTAANLQKGDDKMVPGEDDVLDRMDFLWHHMTVEEIQEVNKLPNDVSFPPWWKESK
jgi:hypothetical protein